MKRRIQLFFLRVELLRCQVNSHLPQLFKITKVGLITTFISLFLATSVVFAQSQNEERVNLDMWQENQLLYWLKNAAIGTRATSYNADGTVASHGANYYLQEFIGQTYEETDQVSAVAYIQDTLEQANVIKPVYAQATGYATLHPILNLWKKVRDIALTAVIIVGLVIALMILFRVRQGQDYVSILNAIPKLIATIVLIIASYAMGGLMLDLSTLSTKVVVRIFFDEAIVNKSAIGNWNAYPATILDESGKVYQKGKTEPLANTADYNIFRLLSVLTNFESWGPRECDSDEQQNELWDGTEWEGMCPLRVRDIVAAPTNIGFLDWGLKIEGATGIGQWGIELILQVFVLMIVFKVFFTLIGAFAQLVLRTLSAPLEFLTVPLRGFGAVSGWAKGVLSQVLVFPATLLMILIAAVLAHYQSAPYYINLEGEDAASLGLFSNAPYFLTHSVQPGGLNILGRILALVIISQISNLPKLINQALQIAPPAAVGEEFGQRLRAAAGKIPVVGGLVNWMS
jgi:hypothetical protein